MALKTTWEHIQGRMALEVVWGSISVDTGGAGFSSPETEAPTKSTRAQMHAGDCNVGGAIVIILWWCMPDE